MNLSKHGLPVVRTFAVVSALTLTLGLAACAAPKTPTCQEFAEMAPDTGLVTSFTSEQTSALKDALDATGYDDNAYNQTIARAEVIAYCNIYDGVASSNLDEPITNAL